MLKVKHIIAKAAVATFLLAASTASAATIDFGSQPGSYPAGTYQEDGFEFTLISLDNSAGNCPFSQPACLKLNGANYETATMTLIGGGTFDLTSFSYEFSGNANPNTLYVFAPADAGSPSLEWTVGVNGVAKNTSYSWSGLFSGVTSVMFATSIGGTVRIDTIGTANECPTGQYPCGPNVGVVPVPAGLPLLLSAFGVGAFVTRRNRKQA